MGGLRASLLMHWFNQIKNNCLLTTQDLCEWESHKPIHSKDDTKMGAFTRYFYKEQEVRGEAL